MQIASTAESHNASVANVTDSGLIIEVEPLDPYLWLPYVILTVILVMLLIASFLNFHFKYKDRYLKRTHDVNGGINGFANNSVMDILVNGHIQNTPPRRLQMFHYRINVADIIRESMLDSASRASTGHKR